LSELKANHKIIYKLVHLYAYNEEDKKDMYQECCYKPGKAMPLSGEKPSAVPDYINSTLTQYLS
jgi:hypothetical protein